MASSPSVQVSRGRANEGIGAPEEAGEGVEPSVGGLEHHPSLDLTGPETRRCL